jgi:hypothetical protein
MKRRYPFLALQTRMDVGKLKRVFPSCLIGAHGGNDVKACHMPGFCRKRAGDDARGRPEVNLMEDPNTTMWQLTG